LDFLVGMLHGRLPIFSPAAARALELGSVVTLGLPNGDLVLGFFLVLRWSHGSEKRG